MFLIIKINDSNELFILNLELFRKIVNLKLFDSDKYLFTAVVTIMN